MNYAKHDPLCPWETEDWRGNSRRCECKLIDAVVRRETMRLYIEFNKNLVKILKAMEDRDVQQLN